LVNTHLTVSPGVTLKVAVRLPTSPVESESSQTIVFSDQFEPGSLSVDVYVPACSFVTEMVPPSEIVPDALPVNVNVSAAPSGSVCFSTTMPEQTSIDPKAKSFSCELGSNDVRVEATKLLMHGRVGKSDVRLMPPSKNAPAGKSESAELPFGT